MVKNFELNEWETEGDFKREADLVIPATFRGQEISAMFHIEGNRLWFAPRGWGKEWNFLVGSAYGHDLAIWDGRTILEEQRDQLLSAIAAPRWTRFQQFQLVRYCRPFYFTQKGTAFFNIRIVWEYQNDFSTDFLLHTTSFWREVAEYYRARHDVALALEWLQMSPEEQRDWLHKIHPRWKDIVVAATRLAHQNCSRPPRDIRLCFGWNTSRLKLNHLFFHENPACRQIIRLALARFPASFRGRRVAKRAPLLKNALGSFDNLIYELPITVRDLSAHEKLEDLLLLREFLAENMTESEADSLLVQLQS